MESLKSLIQAGQNVNAMDRFGDTPLGIAIGDDSQEIVQVLVDGGADPNRTDGNGNSFIHLAVRQGNPEIVRTLVKAGANPDEKDFVGNPAIQVAIGKNSPDIVRILLEAGSDPNGTNFIGNPIIHEAIGIGANPDIVRILVEAGANLNAIEKPGRFSQGDENTALGEAVKLGNLEVVQLLTEAGADVNAKTIPFGESALEIAVRQGHPEIIEILKTAASNPDRATPVPLATPTQIPTPGPTPTPTPDPADTHGPDAPTNVQYALDGSTIRVSWEVVDGADYYDVYYDDSFDSSCSLRTNGRPSFCEELAMNVAETTYVHARPESAENYYWVTACNSSGCSEINSESPASPIEAKPSGPTNVRYAREGSAIRVSWDAVDGADYYNVYHDDFHDSNCRVRWDGRPSFCEELATNVAETTYVHTIPGDDENYYWVVACNCGGCSTPRTQLGGSKLGQPDQAPRRRPVQTGPRWSRSTMPWTEKTGE